MPAVTRLGWRHAETKGWQLDNAVSLGVPLMTLNPWIGGQTTREASNALHRDMDRAERA